MPSVALVSGADQTYFPLLREWIQSVRRFDEAASMDIAILDAGLTAEQRTELAPLVSAIVSPPWPEGLSPKKTKGKDRLKSCVCRPFIRELFPHYDLYMWMDADTWIQNWSGVSMFLQAAASKKDRIVATNGADRSYPKQFRVKWIGRWPYKIANFYFSNGKKAFDFATAKKLCTHYSISAGCFAMAAESPLWNAWQKLVAQAAKKGKLFTAEQLSLGKLIYLDGFKADLLPVHTFWSFGDALPLWDSNRNLFVEPFSPHTPLGILHLCGVDNQRASHNNKSLIETTDGALIKKSLRYPHLDAGDLSLVRPKRG
ncbi:MAG: hypothetical protein PHS57_01510 [Alphaproteobacteria bacterium]|nr:hypothetical protein [Alphaproteobacteria bacterium]